MKTNRNLLAVFTMLLALFTACDQKDSTDAAVNQSEAVEPEAVEAVAEAVTPEPEITAEAQHEEPEADSNELVVGQRYWINTDMTEVFYSIDGESLGFAMLHDDIDIIETAELWSKVSFVYYGFAFEGWIRNEYISDINPRPVILTDFEKKLVGEWIIPGSTEWKQGLISIRDNKTLAEYYEYADPYMNWEYDPQTSKLNCVNETESTWYSHKILSVSDNELIIENGLGEKVEYIRNMK